MQSDGRSSAFDYRDKQTGTAGVLIQAGAITWKSGDVAELEGSWYESADRTHRARYRATRDGAAWRAETAR
jgi:hypothetical protein